MTIDYSKYGVPTGAMVDPATGMVLDSNGNFLGKASDFGGTQGQNGEWSAPSANYMTDPKAGSVMVQQGALSSIPTAGIGNFTTGADTLQKQGLVAGSSSMEGVPTVFNDAQGNPQYFYGNASANGANGTTDNGNQNWYKYSDLAPIQGYDSSGNQVSVTPSAAVVHPSQYDTGALNRSFLGGNAMVLGGMLGAGALDAAMAGGVGAGAEAFPVTGGSAIPGTALPGSTASVWEAGALPSAGGITASQALNGAKTAAGLLSLLSSGASPGSSVGSPLASQGQGGTNVSANGPWNTPLKPQTMTWTPHQQAPVTAGDEHLSMLSPDQGSSSSYFTYGSAPPSNPPAQTQEPLSFAKGGNVHIPEFITGETGNYVKGKGDGQSDDIPAMLADGEYVFDADIVAALGNGSSDAGAEVLDGMREAIRKHKRSAPINKIPPPSKSPLAYLSEGMKRK